MVSKDNILRSRGVFCLNALQAIYNLKQWRGYGGGPFHGSRANFTPTFLIIFYQFSKSLHVLMNKMENV